MIPITSENIFEISIDFICSFYNQYQTCFLASQDVTLVIRGRSDSGQTIEIRQETTVTNEETQIVRIKIGDLGEGKYVDNFTSIL